MPNDTVPAAARGLPQPPTLFLAITPEIRRALALLAEASISLLDEIDAPVEGLEDECPENVGDDEPSLGWISDERGCLIPCSSTDDRELECEDEGAQCDDEGIDDDPEPNLGWNVDGEFTGHEDREADFVAPETSGGYGTGTTCQDRDEYTAQRALFDRRIGLRPKTDCFDRRFPIPRFPHESPDRPGCVMATEWQRLYRFLAERRIRPVGRPGGRRPRR